MPLAWDYWFVIVVVVLVVGGIIASSVFMVQFKNQLTVCETTESLYCPSSYCPTASTVCQHRPYRHADPNTCQTTALEQVSKKLKPTST